MGKLLFECPVDMAYFCFFLIHVPVTLLIDIQALYPRSFTPRFIAKLPEIYVRMSQDPLIGGAMGYFGISGDYVWFKTFLILELCFQLPVFFIAMHGLLRDSKNIHVLLLVYAASTATTTLPCLAVVLGTPTTSPETISANLISVTSAQRWLLLVSYLPFFLIPFAMAIDMALRLADLVDTGIRAEADKVILRQ